MNRRTIVLAVPASMLAACAAPPKQGLLVSVASIEPVSSAASELRARVTLRIQNPNDTNVSFGGASVELSLRGESVGSGVSAGGGQLPRLGEVLLPITVTVSRPSAVRQAVGLYGSADRPLTYRVSGTLNAASGTADPVRFESVVEFAFPGAVRP